MKRFSFLFFAVFFSLCFYTINISAQEIKPNPKISTGGVLNGKAIKFVVPEYPPAAKAVRAGGAVNVQVWIDEEGNVTSARAVSGHPLLRSVSEEAAKESKFTPTKLEGKAVKVNGIVVYNFTPGDTKTTVVQEEEIEKDVLNDKALKLPSPETPPAARAVNASGKVKIKVTLDEKGNVTSATTVSGHPLLRDSAIKAAKKAKFDTDKIEFKEGKAEGTIVYVFPNLLEEKEN